MARLLISAGGTGGGVFPALSAAQTLIAEWPQLVAPDEVLWLGGRGGMEAEIVRRAGLRLETIHAAGVHGVGWRLPLNALSLLRGLGEALRVMRRFRPAAVLVTGGYLAVPAAVAAWLSRVPVMIYLPDLEPGLALKAISRLARRVAVTAESARRFFPPERVVVTGYPVRPELARAGRAEAERYFGLDPQRRTLLVTGGSRGARSLNRALGAALPELLKDYQVIHLSGQLDWEAVEQARAALPETQRARYHAFPFLHAMGLALAAADLVVSRAGASALGEYPLFGLPALLVPYPHAWRYQKVNADHLVERGAAVLVNDAELPQRLLPEVRRLLDSPRQLETMRAAARAAARPQAASDLARELAGLLAGGAIPA